MKKRWITYKEAAEIAGVSKITISNLCKAGVLSYKKRHTTFFVDKEQVERYADEMFEIVQAENDLCSYREELEVEKTRLANELRELQYKCEMTRIDSYITDLRPHRARIVSQFVESLLPHFNEVPEITPRELEIVMSLFNSHSASDTAYKFNLTRASINATWHNFLFKLKYIKRMIVDKDAQITKLQSQTHQMQSVIDNHLAMVEKLKRMVIEGVVDKDIDFTLDNEGEIVSIIPHKIFSTRLVDMDLSVRALNCLRAAEIDTLKDLVMCYRNDLLKFRNFGKKSLTELDEFLERLGLRFNMDELDIREYTIEQFKKKHLCTEDSLIS